MQLAPETAYRVVVAGDEVSLEYGVDDSSDTGCNAGVGEFSEGVG